MSACDICHAISMYMISIINASVEGTMHGCTTISSKIALASAKLYLNVTECRLASL